MVVYFKGADGWYARTEGQPARKVTCLLWESLDLLMELGAGLGVGAEIAAEQPDYILWPQERDKHHVGSSADQ